MPEALGHVELHFLRRKGRNKRKKGKCKQNRVRERERGWNGVGWGWRREPEVAVRSINTASFE